MRAVFGRLEHPTRVDAKTGEPLSLGSRPRTFQSRDERVARALAAEPDATEERRAEIRNEVYAQTRKAVAYYDLTFSPVKSVSVYWTALLEAGRDAEAAERGRGASGRGGGGDGLRRAADRLRAVGLSRQDQSGQSVGVYEQARGLVWIRWDHSTSRAQQPQLHSHVTVLNRAETTSDGVIRRWPAGASNRSSRPPRRSTPRCPTRPRRLQRGGVRDPPGRQGSRDRRVLRAAAGQGVLADGRHHGAAERARRAVRGGPRAGPVPGREPADPPGRLGGKPARRKTTRWRRGGS